VPLLSAISSTTGYADLPKKFKAAALKGTQVNFKIWWDFPGSSELCAIQSRVTKRNSKCADDIQELKKAYRLAIMKKSVSGPDTFSVRLGGSKEVAKVSLTKTIF
jgi:hypothetical protein